MCVLMMIPALVFTGEHIARPVHRSPHAAGSPMNQVPQSKEQDRVVLDTLREVHNQGAELYNSGDHVGALRLYQGGLIVAKAFLAHREKQHAAIQEGLEQIQKSQADPKLKAFRLHEVLEQVRSEMKADLRKPVDRNQKSEAAVTGRLTRNGQPLAGITLSLIPAASKLPMATVRSQEDGTFRVPTSVTNGQYCITLAGDGVPENYNKVETTPLKADLKEGVNTLNLSVNSQ